MPKSVKQTKLQINEWVSQNLPPPKYKNHDNGEKKGGYLSDLSKIPVGEKLLGDISHTV